MYCKHRHHARKTHEVHNYNDHNSSLEGHSLDKRKVLESQEVFGQRYILVSHQVGRMGSTTAHLEGCELGVLLRDWFPDENYLIILEEACAVELVRSAFYRLFVVHSADPECLADVPVGPESCFVRRVAWQQLWTFPSVV